MWPWLPLASKKSQPVSIRRPKALVQAGIGTPQPLTMSHCLGLLIPRYQSRSVMRLNVSQSGRNENQPAFKTLSLPGQPINFDAIGKSNKASIFMRGKTSASSTWIRLYSVCCQAHNL